MLDCKKNFNHHHVRCPNYDPQCCAHPSAVTIDPALICSEKCGQTHLKTEWLEQLREAMRECTEAFEQRPERTKNTWVE